MVIFVGFDAAIASAGAWLPGLPAGGWPHALVALVAAAWLAAASLAVIRASRSNSDARTARDWAMRMRALLASLPGGYIIVRGDGSAICSQNVRDWLGLVRADRLDDLSPAPDVGLVPADLALLKRQVEALGAAGERFSLPVRTAGGRWLLAQGQPAGPELAGSRGAVIWIRETTEEHGSIEKLRGEHRRLTDRVENLSGLLSVAPLPMWTRGADLKLTSVNTAYAASVRAESPEQVVRDGIELTAPHTALAAARRARDSGEVQVREETVIIGEERRVLRIVEAPLSDGGVGGTAIDVTERDEAVDERDRLERAQTDTLDRLTAGVALFGADHNLAFHNKAFAQLFRLDAPWLDEKPQFDRVLDRMRDVSRLPEQRDFPSWRAARRAWFTDATSAVEETWALPDSSIIHVIAQPHPDGGLLMVFEDRSEQLRIASSRDTLLRVQQATLDNLHEGVAVFGADGRIQFSNARYAEIFGFDPIFLAARPHVDEMLALRGHLVQNDDRGTFVRETIRAATDAQRREARTQRLMFGDGRLLDFASVPLPDGNVLFTYLDITDSARIQAALSERNEALEAADKLKSAFVANVSYELRTPLTAISGFGEMLAEGYAGSLNDRQQDYTKSILTSSQRLRLLIDDILDLAITEAGELELDLGPVPVAAIAREALETIGPDAEAKRMTLVAEIDDAGEIEGDERRLRQTLHNLLMNALRFTPSGGQIELRVESGSDEVRICVRDNGVGIPEGEQAAVFERFRKGSNAGAQGVGLGLALVREFVELHHGTVALASKPGEGTEVTLRLPRRQDR